MKISNGLKQLAGLVAITVLYSYGISQHLPGQAPSVTVAAVLLSYLLKEYAVLSGTSSQKLSLVFCFSVVAGAFMHWTAYVAAATASIYGLVTFSAVMLFASIVKNAYDSAKADKTKGASNIGKDEAAKS